MDAADVLIQAYWDTLNAAGLGYPVYSKFVPAIVTDDAYIVIEATSTNENPVKYALYEAVTIQVSIFSRNTSVDVDKLAGQVREKIYSNQRKCLIIVPSNYQTDIDSYNSNAQTFNLFQDDSFTNRILIFNHRFQTHE